MTSTRNTHVPLSTTLAAATLLVAPLLAGGMTTASAAEPDISLQREAGTVLSSATVAVPVDEPVSTTEFTMVAATWSGDDPGIEVRTRVGGAWTSWVEFEELGDGPDASGREASGSRPSGASDLIWVGESDAVEVRAAQRATDLELVLINPGVKAGDSAAALAPAPAPRTPNAGTPKAGTPNAGTLKEAAPAATRRTVPRPKIRTRKQWGADESWRDGTPRYTGALKQVHVHHTVNANVYAKGDVPGILRGIYRYHTKTLGWFDVGYNFLVDRWGQIWEGRSGGVDRMVLGAHTLGFNHNSTGVAVIGNYDTRTASTTVLRALADITAWKFDSNNRSPRGTIVRTSTGSDKYAKDTNVRLNRIDGHRDTNDTSCPGHNLYQRLPLLRTMAYNRMYTS